MNYFRFLSIGLIALFCFSCSGIIDDSDPDGNQNAELEWKYEVSYGLGAGTLNPIPCIDDDNNSYFIISNFTDNDNMSTHFISLDKDGKLRWDKDYSTLFKASLFSSNSSPVYSSGNIYVNSGNSIAGFGSSLICFNAATGEVKWTLDESDKDVHFSTNGLAIHNNTLWVTRAKNEGTTSNPDVKEYLAAYSLSGSLISETEIDGLSNIIVCGKSTIYVLLPGKLASFDNSGNMITQTDYSTNMNYLNAIAVDNQDNLVSGWATSGDVPYYLCSYSKNGTLNWEKDLQYGLDISVDGEQIYVTQKGLLILNTDNGNEIREVTIPADINMTSLLTGYDVNVLIGDDDMLYSGGGLGCQLSASTDKAFKWTSEPGVFANYRMDFKGRLIIPAIDGSIYCIKTSSDHPKTGTWNGSNGNMYNTNSL